MPPGTDAVRQDGTHVIDGSRQDDDLRKIAVWTGIGGVADQVRDPVQYLVLAEQLDQVVLEGGRGAFGASDFGNLIRER